MIGASLTSPCVVISHNLLPHRSKTTSRSGCPEGSLCFLAPNITEPSSAVTGDVTANQSEFDPHKTSPAALKAEMRPVSDATRIALSLVTEAVKSLSLPAVLRFQASLPSLEMAYNKQS